MSIDGRDSQKFCYLTTTGRVSGRPHTIEIGFARRGSTLYLLSSGGDRADWVRNLGAQPGCATWVRNLRSRPGVAVRIGRRNALELPGRARVLDPGSPEDELARDLRVEKYQPGYGGDLGGWRRPSLAVAIDLETRPMAEPGRAWTVEAANAGLPRVREVLERIRGPRQVRTIATGSCRGQRSRCWSWRPRSV